jgi:hypothetical protein
MHRGELTGVRLSRALKGYVMGWEDKIQVRPGIPRPKADAPAISAPVLVFLPSPDQSIFGVSDVSNVSEAALDQDASRSVLLPERVSPDDENLPGAKRESDQRVGRFSRVTPALILGRNPVRNLHGLIRARRPLESALSYDALGDSMHEIEAQRPNRIGTGGGLHPARRKRGFLIGVHAFELRTDLFQGWRNQLQALGLERCCIHWCPWLERPKTAT